MEYMNYDLMQNAEGVLVIIIDELEYELDRPRFVYDGGEIMRFYPDPLDAYTLNVEEVSRDPLSKADEVLLVEVDENGKMHETRVPVRHVTSLLALLQ